MENEIIKSLIRVLPFAAVATILIVKMRQGKINKYELDFVPPTSPTRFLISWLGFTAFVLLSELILYKLGILETDKWNHSLLPSVIRIAGAVALAPIAEELLFRGILLNVLHKRIHNIHAAVFIQASLFVLMHTFTYEHSLSSNIGIAQSFTDAVLFGYCRVYTKSLYTPIAMHATGNLVATLERFIL